MPKVIRGRGGSVALSWSSKEINARLTAEYEASAQRNRVNGERYAVVEMGFPRELWGVWDFRRRDFVRDNGGLGRAIRGPRRATAEARAQSLNAAIGVEC